MPLIAHVLPFPTIGGTEQATLRLAVAAKRNGFDSIMFYPRESPVGDFFAGNGFPIVPYDRVEPSITSPAAYWKNSRALAADFRRHNVALIHHADLLGAHYTSFGGLLAGKRMICYIRCRHNSVTKRDRIFLRPISKYVFVSRNAWDDFALKVSPDRGCVLYDGIAVTPPPTPNPSLREELGLSPEHTIVTMVARVAPPKDFSTLARAAVTVTRKYPKVRFLLVGDTTGADLIDRTYADVTRELQALGVAPYFVFAGFRRNINEILALTDISVLCTKSEGLPLVILEAMAAGKPVVATRVGGIPEIIEHGSTGLLHDLEDSDQLASALLTLLDNPAERQRVGEAGQQFVMEQFSEDHFVEEVGKLYRSLLVRAM